MANFTTENNTYCFRIGPAFLDTEMRCRNQQFAFIFFRRRLTKTKSIELLEKNSLIPLISAFCSKSLAFSR